MHVVPTAIKIQHHWTEKEGRRIAGYLVYVEVFNNGVEAGIQVIQKIHHLEKETHRRKS
jgi:hypothetical protein